MTVYQPHQPRERREMNELEKKVEAYECALELIANGDADSPGGIGSIDVARTAIDEFKPHPLEGLPVDTLVYAQAATGHFSMVKDGEAMVFAGGRSSKTRMASTVWNVTALAEGEWVYWGGGECPLPGWVVVKIHLRDSVLSDTGAAHSFGWDESSTMSAHVSDIIGYKIVAQEIPKG